MRLVPVALGGAAGTLLRLLLTQGHAGPGWDVRMVVVNVLGAFLLGVVSQLRLRPGQRDFLMTGGLGTLTSFSILAVAFVDGTRASTAWLGLLASVVLGLGAALAGILLGRLLTADELGAGA
ncbi:MAG: CrcB family protein [Intrasporangium sp.]|uniref:fluoride efflux transporter FluC n=1 Tax=Intrasporangium sp. TaxID=1925024 RepID=UPI002647DD41|nr:CrcB family protein [Intrasporangium sp.]MDN5797731.1 CrcB family protein [Intrasporangium sp.]